MSGEIVIRNIQIKAEGPQFLSVKVVADEGKQPFKQSSVINDSVRRFALRCPLGLGTPSAPVDWRAGTDLGGGGQHG